MTTIKARLHTAEHIFWAFLKKNYPEIKTEAMEFRDNAIRLDYRQAERVDIETIQTMENDVNNAIKTNLSVVFETVSKDKAKKIVDISLLPANIKEVRLVKIGNISIEACIGDHARNTSEIEKFRILEIKKSGEDKLRVCISVGDEKINSQPTKSGGKVRPQTLKGFRDLLPQEAAIKQKVISIMRLTFESFGFQPLETPTLEYASTLLGKSGEEAEKLMYLFKDRGGREVGLRYDLTVPACKVMAMYPDKIPLPFKRYQMQNCFRAEKPQRGRYREFTQCDIDIFGVQSALADGEIIQVIYTSLKNLGFKEFQININSRQVLFKILASANINDKSLQLSVLQSIDKLDKLEKETVEKELIKKGLSSEQIKKIFLALKNAQPDEDLRKIFSFLKANKIDEKFYRFLPSLVRGLDYYTRAIYETYVTKPKIGSVTGGGRYDSLVKQLGGPDITGTGTTIGFERIVEVIKDQNLWPETSTAGAKVLVTIFNPELADKANEAANLLRENGIPTEIYLDPAAKLDKQLKYADRKGIPFVVIIGPDEAKTNTVTLKNLKDKTQEKLSYDGLAKKVSLR